MLESDNCTNKTIPGILISSYMCKCFGRRITLIAFFFVCGISNSFLTILDQLFYLKLVIGSVGISSACGAFAAVYMYTTELFPTVTRNMAMGLSSTASRVGSMIAPFIAGATVAGGWVPPTIFGLFPLIAAIACYCLPETKGMALIDHVEK